MIEDIDVETISKDGMMEAGMPLIKGPFNSG